METVCVEGVLEISFDYQRHVRNVLDCKKKINVLSLSPQAHKWLKALLEALVKAHSHVGRSSEEIRRLKTEHQQFQVSHPIGSEDFFHLYVF